MYKLTSLSIFFPALNDAKSLPDLIRKVDKIASEVSQKHEIIIIDDGSTDNTRAVLEELKKEIYDLRIISHQRNEGYGAALRDGIKNAQYEWVFYTDGDGQYDVEELKLLVSVIARSEATWQSQSMSSSGLSRGSSLIEIVNGYKIKRGDGLVRSILGAVYNTIMHLCYRLPIRDVDCDFRLIRKSTLDKISLSATSGSICVELITKLAAAGARFAETPVHHFPRKYGTSQFFSLRHLLQTVAELLF